MKRFLKGFVWNFLVLLLLFTGFRFWTTGPKWLGVVCFVVILVVAAMRFRDIRQRLRDQQSSNDSE